MFNLITRRKPINDRTLILLAVQDIVTISITPIIKNDIDQTQ